jgi:ubiquinone/menaquinone biosynthesis C-methylase UbiE
MRSEPFLEVGIGTGKNLRYYPANARAVGVDLSEGMLSRAAGRPDRRDLALIQADVQRLPFGDHTFATVVATFVFCSVPDPILRLQEIHRVLKPNGELLMLEHVLPDNPVLAWLFNVLNPLVVGLGGVRINRKTAENIRTSGFVLLEEVNLLSTVFKLFVAKPA